jgi:hypothetical protein
MKKWYSYETMNPNVKDEFRRYLRQNHIYYELSECFNGWHFEIELEEENFETVDWFLWRINEYIV